MTVAWYLLKGEAKLFSFGFSKHPSGGSPFLELVVLLDGFKGATKSLLVWLLESPNWLEPATSKQDSAVSRVGLVWRQKNKMDGWFLVLVPVFVAGLVLKDSQTDNRPSHFRGPLFKATPKQTP